MRDLKTEQVDCIWFCIDSNEESKLQSMECKRMFISTASMTDLQRVLKGDGRENKKELGFVVSLLNNKVDMAELV